MSSQCTDTILMIRPASFGYNAQTAVNNYYQKTVEMTAELQQQALFEFDAMVGKLVSKSIDVIVVEDTIEPETPDAIFPNNWLSLHRDGIAVLYPMYAENRRLERRKDVLELLENLHGFIIDEIRDYSPNEEDKMYLEGTGSMVLDRTNKIAYASMSERTDPQVLDKVCEDLGFRIVSFHANQTVEEQRLPIYHTNVMMCVGEGFAVVCLDAIDDVDERQEVIASLEETDKEIIEISEDQVSQFAGNMLQVRSRLGSKYLVMSTSAFNSLDQTQKQKISNYAEIIHSPIDTIESLGGGSARCMMAEVFLPKQY